MILTHKLAAENLNGIRRSKRSKTYWHALRHAAITKLLFRTLAVVVALASIAAVSLVTSLSFGAAAAAILLVICPLREAYQSLPTLYERFIDWLAKKFANS